MFAGGVGRRRLRGEGPGEGAGDGAYRWEERRRLRARRIAEEAAVKVGGRWKRPKANRVRNPNKMSLDEFQEKWLCPVEKGSSGGVETTWA